MHNFLYSLTICLLHYYPRHVSSINMPIFRRKNYIHTASVIFALCKRLNSTLVESGYKIQYSVFFHSSTVHRDTIKFLFSSNGCTIKCSKQMLKCTLKLTLKCPYIFRFKQPSSGSVAFVLC